MTEYRPTRAPSPEARAAHGGLTCYEFDNFIDDYFDDALGPVVRATFEAHLKVCPGCEAYLADYRRAMLAVRAASAPGASGGGPAPDNERRHADAPPDLIAAILRGVRG
jgi:anti-sigma factor RsiW